MGSGTVSYWARPGLLPVVLLRLKDPFSHFLHVCFPGPPVSKPWDHVGHTIAGKMGGTGAGPASKALGAQKGSLGGRPSSPDMPSRGTQGSSGGSQNRAPRGDP